MFEHCGRRTTTTHGYTMSSPCEPEGSCELRKTSKGSYFCSINEFDYAPNFEKLMGHIALECPWMRAWVGGWVRACVTLSVPTVTFKTLKLES